MKSVLVDYITTESSVSIGGFSRSFRFVQKFYGGKVHVNNVCMPVQDTILAAFVCTHFGVLLVFPPNSIL